MFLFWRHTLKHKVFVFLYLLIFCSKLMLRAFLHDYSKLGSYEGSRYGKTFPEFKKVKYGTPEYDAVLSKSKEALNHHYKHNRHHPEHFKESYSEMNLLDFIEMFYDWKAASRKTGSLEKSLVINSVRFRMSSDIKQIMQNSLDI